jgi:hypothetical protein
LFRDDPDDDGSNFKVDPMTQDSKNDNFQLAFGWFTNSVKKVDDGEQRLATSLEAPVEYVDRLEQRKGRPGDLAFRSMPAHAQTRYAISLEKQSIRDVPATFGQIAQDEWDRAYREWLKFGDYPFPAFNKQEQKIRIDDATVPERFHALDDNGQYWTNNWANQQNYPYWKDRCLAEKTPKGVDARRYFYEGTLALKAASFRDAVEKFKIGLNIWTELLDQHPNFRDDDLNKRDTGHIVRRYVVALRQAGQEEPADLPFKDLYEAVKNDRNIDPFDQLEAMRSVKNTPPTGSGDQANPSTSPGVSPGSSAP